MYRITACFQNLKRDLQATNKTEFHFCVFFEYFNNKVFEINVLFNLSNGKTNYN